MINIISTSGHATYGIKEFVADTEADLQTLPANTVPGSSVFVIENSKTYLYGPNLKWNYVEKQNKDVNEVEF